MSGVPSLSGADLAIMPLGTRLQLALFASAFQIFGQSSLWNANLFAKVF
jgi:hypothetical protein